MEDTVKMSNAEWEQNFYVNAITQAQHLKNVLSIYLSIPNVLHSLKCLLLTH